MTNKRQGYIYRFSDLDATGVRGLIRRYVQQGYAFECDIARALHPPAQFESADDPHVLPLNSDTGYVFSAHAEVRWQRNAQGVFDALLLTEHAHPDVQTSAQQIGAAWELRSAGVQAPIFMTRPTGSKNTPRIAQEQYVAPNGTVQFVRYKEVKG